jgi:uncharacterized protein YndB with AHSA1/START domain
MMQNLIAKARIQIASDSSKIFDAIVDPEKMSNYFIKWGSDKMEEGKSVQWLFPEFDEKFEVRTIELKAPHHISFSWGEGAESTDVLIDIETIDGNSSVVSVVESGKENNDAGIAWMRGNTEGWANFLACLKAWLEYGINLRKGAFEFMRKKN